MLSSLNTLADLVHDTRNGIKTMTNTSDRKPPLLTIAICCYREGEWLRECWGTVLAQTDHCWEAVLVLDGGADERTTSIFNTIEHPRLRKHVCKDNLRHGGTRNLAFELTRTPYHFYVDADDLLVPDSVSSLLQGFEQCPDAAMVYGDIELFGDRTELRRYPDRMTPDVLARLEALQGSGAAYSMAAWRAMGGLAKEMWASGSDYDFNIGLCEKGFQFHRVPRVVYRYRRYNTSNSENNAYRCWEKHEMMVRRHPAFFADATRKRDFLTTAYAYSFRALYEANDLVRAKDVARRAVSGGWAGHEYWPMQLLARLPLPVFKALVPLWRLRHRRLSVVSC